MAAERIGKLERWILIHAYLKIVKGDLPDDWKKTRGQKRGERLPENIKQRITEALKDSPVYLYKSEILLNYFDLKLSYKESFFDNQIEKFEDTVKYHSALASYTRTITNMLSKELIVDYIGVNRPQWRGLVLSEKGKQKAEVLLDS